MKRPRDAASPKRWKSVKDDARVVVAALGLVPEREEPVRQRLEAIGGIGALWHAGAEALAEVLGEGAEARLDAFLELSRRRLKREPLPQVIDGAEAVASYFVPRLALKATESFYVVLLDARGRMIGAERVAEGTLTSCLVHPREVFAAAIRLRAAHVVLVHNHPSGDPTPSPEDIQLTQRMVEAGHILGIPVVDHVVIGREGFRSIGLIDPPGDSVRG